ncbi:TetR/AcrR family transcriptional regulator [Actibacterium sp. XHP0104]|uniref:TetR/AcrR family transcriptional regulator n=1 Tax=Actibacterium sp. XHP0104 TaxID=2984335 RepID=UPI0021E963A5|nr:TetR/AcrR family transcriptional regulator [Actibacterium sp. XHP0104]MCV2881679.1 TetR/AcrR family transcriptional regulator [Actibacterium sp. XHP0104]
MAAFAEQIRKGRKFDQVLDGAREVFMRDGYEGASVDDIARAAGVSKATLYSYFPDKRLLFLEAARSECQRQARRALDQLDPAAPVEHALRTAAEHMIGFLLSTFGQGVYRLCVAESDRFPELGQMFYASGPAHVREQISAYLQYATARGDLAITDFDLAADQFTELCRADLFPKVIFGVQTRFSESEIRRVIDGAISTFMARYGTHRG